MPGTMHVFVINWIFYFRKVENCPFSINAFFLKKILGVILRVVLLGLGNKIIQITRSKGKKGLSMKKLYGQLWTNLFLKK